MYIKCRDEFCSHPYYTILNIFFIYKQSYLTERSKTENNILRKNVLVLKIACNFIVYCSYSNTIP